MIGIIRRTTGSALLVLVSCSSDPSSTNHASDAGAPIVVISPELTPDPRDLDASNGDPALDIGGSQIYFDGAVPWVRVAFYGAWPPSAAYAEWGCTVLVGTENAPVATYTRLGDQGAESDLVDGIDAAMITYVAEPNGFRVRFADPNLVFDRYAVQCNLQKTNDTQPVEDSSGAFVFGAKTARPFG